MSEKTSLLLNVQLLCALRVCMLILSVSVNKRFSLDYDCTDYIRFDPLYYSAH